MSSAGTGGARRTVRSTVQGGKALREGFERGTFAPTNGSPARTTEVGDPIAAHLLRSSRAIAALPAGSIRRAADVLAAAYRDRRRIFTLGNGGSAATASHMACDLGNNVVAANRPRLDITSLSENAATLTALANDRGYAAVFADQLTGISCPGDVLIAISGSGNSRNVVETLSAGRAAGLTTIALLGRGGGRARLLADVDISVADDDYGVIEDAHLAISHALVQELHARLAEDSSA